MPTIGGVQYRTSSSVTDKPGAIPGNWVPIGQKGTTIYWGVPGTSLEGLIDDVSELTGTNALIAAGFAQTTSATRLSWMPADWVIIGTAPGGVGPAGALGTLNVWGPPGGPADTGGLSTQLQGFIATDTELQSRLGITGTDTGAAGGGGGGAGGGADESTPTSIWEGFRSDQYGYDAMLETLTQWYAANGSGSISPEEAADNFIDIQLASEGGGGGGGIGAGGATGSDEFAGGGFQRTPAQILAEQEASDPRGFFERFLTRQDPDFATASPFARSAALNRAGDVISQFRLLGDPFTDPEQLGTSFESFLAGGQPTVSALQGGLRNLQDLLKTDPTGLPQAGLARRGFFDVETGGGAALGNLRQALLQPTLAGLSPAFRAPFVNTAQDVFSRLMAMEPERRLINLAGERGFF